MGVMPSPDLPKYRGQRAEPIDLNTEAANKRAFHELEARNTPASLEKQVETLGQRIQLVEDLVDRLAELLGE
jgi:hypothetical protein